MEHWNLDIIGYWIIATACLIEKDLKLSPGPPKFLKLLPCLYLSIGQVWWLNDLWFKGYIQKCNDTYTKYSSWRHRFGKSWDGLKYKNLNILRMEQNVSTK